MIDEIKEQEYDPIKMQALEETVFHTNHTIETLLNLLVEKGFFTRQELLQKMDDLSEHEDIEEIGFDANAPRDVDDKE